MNDKNGMSCVKRKTGKHLIIVYNTDKRGVTEMIYMYKNKKEILEMIKKLQKLIED